MPRQRPAPEVAGDRRSASRDRGHSRGQSRGAGCGRGRARCAAGEAKVATSVDRRRARSGCCRDGRSDAFSGESARKAGRQVSNPGAGEDQLPQHQRSGHLAQRPMGGLRDEWRREFALGARRRRPGTAPDDRDRRRDGALLVAGQPLCRLLRRLEAEESRGHGRPSPDPVRCTPVLVWNLEPGRSHRVLVDGHRLVPRSGGRWTTR